MTYRERNFNQTKGDIMKYVAIVSIAVLIAALASLTLHHQDQDLTPLTLDGTTTLSVQPKTSKCIQACSISPQRTTPIGSIQNAK